MEWKTKPNSNWHVTSGASIWLDTLVGRRRPFRPSSSQNYGSRSGPLFMINITFSCRLPKGKGGRNRGQRGSRNEVRTLLSFGPEWPHLPRGVRGEKVARWTSVSTLLPDYEGRVQQQGFQPEPRMRQELSIFSCSWRFRQPQSFVSYSPLFPSFFNAHFDEKLFTGAFGSQLYARSTTAALSQWRVTSLGVWNVEVSPFILYSSLDFLMLSTKSNGFFRK